MHMHWNARAASIRRKLPTTPMSIPTVASASETGFPLS
jgi:hypothetical protein